MDKPKNLLLPLFSVVLALVFAFCFFPGQVSAQTSGIRISPIRFEEIVDPGQTIERTLAVANVSDAPMRLYAYLRDFRAEGENGQPRLIAPGTEEGYFLASWIDITDQGVDFAPGEEKNISYMINVPEDIGPGGYYGAILFGTEPPRLKLDGEEKGAGMAVSQQTGSLVLLRVKGSVKEESRIREFITDKSMYGTPFDIEFLLRVENMGNVHAKPIGTINIKNMFGNDVGSIRVNDSGANVLPNSIRRFTENWQGEMGFGRYNASIGLSYGTPTGMGGQGKQTLYTETVFWIMPWRIIIPTLLTLIIAVALLIIFLKFYKSRAVRKAMEQAGLGHVRLVRKYRGPSPVVHILVIILIVFILMMVVFSLLYFLLFA